MLKPPIAYTAVDPRATAGEEQMPVTTPSVRPARSRRARLLAFATLVIGVLVAGCGGSSPHPATAGHATGAGLTSATGGATTSSSTAPGAYGSGLLTFARCMRANGAPNFPDPQPGGGGFDFHASAAVISSPAFRAAQAQCAKLMPGGGPLSPGPPPSAQTMAQLVRIAACMRQHGVPQFPDPRITPPSRSGLSLLGAYRLITNYKGAILLFPATLDMQSPAYEQAAAACGAGFLGTGPHPH